MDAKYDVVVIGGGTAGTVAAIQAGRAGARTLLVEKNGMLGGTLTVAGVNYPALFFGWGKQVIAGIGWELVTRTLKETDRCPPDFSDPTAAHWKHHTRVDRGIYAALCDEAVLSAGVDLVLHAMPAAVGFEQGAWSLQVCTKSGLERVRARVLIDCTGDANTVTLSGYPVRRPEPVQPGTLTMHCDGYEFDALDLATIDSAVEKAVADGRLRYTDIGWRKEGAGPFLGSHGHNSNHITTIAADTSDGRTRAEIEARRSMLRMYRFFRSQPGLEQFRIEYVAGECGIRESVVIEGKARITGDDYMAGRLFDDAVCYCFYPVDIHLDDGEGVELRRLAPGTLPTIPRGAMLPLGSRFLIVAGRCIAGDRVAHSAYRVEAPCMAMGQAAGAMAALSAQSDVDPEELALDEVYALLRQHGAIVPGDVGV